MGVLQGKWQRPFNLMGGVQVERDKVFFILMGGERGERALKQAFKISKSNKRRKR
ncbi:MAG: hypothetical protein XD96_0064 [Petrotoga mobilis]|nr:MAG: hypothetical protein XD96_0064 [Petrotoga mobilis]